MTSALMDSNARWCSTVQENSAFKHLLVSGVNMYVWSASFGRNEAMYQTSPKNARTSVKLVGIGQSRIFQILDVCLIP